MNKLIIAVLICCLASFYLAAENVEYTREYTHQVGDLDSKIKSRSISLKEIKIQLLSEIGTYISSETQIYSSQGRSIFNEKIIELTAGHVATTIIDEKFDGHEYWIKVKLIVDPSLIENKINDFYALDLKRERLEKEVFGLKKASLKDKENLALSYHENEKLLFQLAELQKQLEMNKTNLTQFKHSLVEYKKVTKQLEPEQIHNKASDYYLGRNGVMVDYNIAFRLFLVAAEQGFVPSQNAVALMYQYGYGVNKNSTKSAYWLKKSRAVNNKVKLYEAGIDALSGRRGTALNYKNAVHLLEQSSKFNYLPAKKMLKALYENKEAHHRLLDEHLQPSQTTSIDKLDVYNRAKDFHFGRNNVSKNINVAFNLYKKSAEQGDAPAQKALGLLYQYGRGVQQDSYQALYWFSKASEFELQKETSSQ